MPKQSGKQESVGPDGRVIARRNRMDPRTEAAIHAMVWLGLPRDQAAAHAGISDHGLYKAFRRPPVKALYLSMVEELRVSEKARNIHVLAEVRDTSPNHMARVAAAKELHRDPDGFGSNTLQRTPGLVINILPSGRHEKVVNISPVPLNPPDDDLSTPDDDTSGVAD